VDTIPITSSSNIVSDAITGLTFTLHDADPGTTVAVSIATDEEAITEKIQAVVDAYNDLMDYVNAQSDEGAILRGNSTLRTVANRIQTLFTYPLGDGEGDLSLMAQVGIRLTDDRRLEFDTTAFKEILGSDYADVRDLFVERGTNLGKGYLIRVAIDDLTDSVDGLFKISDDAFSRKLDNIDDTIVRYERSLETYESTLRRQFTAMESMVSALQAQGNYLAAAMAGAGYYF
jgi:flagellar hook-associated protein 2